MSGVVRVIEMDEDRVGIAILQGVHHRLGGLRGGARIHDDVG